VSDKIAGRRILVIEDSPVVAPFTQAILEELGCQVVGPAGNMAVARELAEQDGTDAALIDVRIRGEKSYPICEILNRRGVPAEWRDRPQLPKPYRVAELEAALLRALS
jgi:CheY-like chemotaxis protein